MPKGDKKSSSSKSKSDKKASSSKSDKKAKPTSKSRSPSPQPVISAPPVAASPPSAPENAAAKPPTPPTASVDLRPFQPYSYPQFSGPQGGAPQYPPAFPPSSAFAVGSMPPPAPPLPSAPYFSQQQLGSPIVSSTPPSLPAVYYGAYAYAHDMTGAYHSRYGSLASVDAQLIAKREKILQQMAKVQGTIEAVQAARRGIERETMADAEAVIHRLRSTEAVKLSVLSHDLETLRSDATAIDVFHSAFSRHCPTTVWSPSETRFDATEQAAHFIAAYPELSAEADRLLAKPLKATVDVRADDFERETVVRQESLRKFDALNELLATKDQMIWKLLKERQAAATDLDTLAKTSAGELQEWKRLVDGLTAKLDSLSLVCAYCALKMSPCSVNTTCPVNTPGNGSMLRAPTAFPSGDRDGDAPEAQLGSRRHYFVHVAEAAKH